MEERISQLEKLLSQVSYFYSWVDSINFIVCAGNLKHLVGARKRVRIELSYRPAKVQRLAESIP